MTPELMQPILERLAADLGVALAGDSTVRVPLMDGTDALVQAADDGALLIHACRQPETDPRVDPTQALGELLARNAPWASPPGAVFAIDADESDVIAFSRMGRPALMTPSAILRWVSAFITDTTGEVATTGPMALLDEPAVVVQARADEFGSLKSELFSLFGVSTEEHDDAGPWMLVPDSGVPVTVGYWPQTGDVFLRSVLSVLPTEASDDERLFRDLVQAHAFGAGTAGSFFAIDEASDEIIVWRCEPVTGLQVADLAAGIANVSAVAQHFTPRPDRSPQCLGVLMA